MKTNILADFQICISVPLLIIREWPKNNPPVSINLDNPHPPLPLSGAFYFTTSPSYNKAQKSTENKFFMCVVCLTLKELHFLQKRFFKFYFTMQIR